METFQKRYTKLLLAIGFAAGSIMPAYAGTTTGQVGSIVIVAGAGGAPGAYDLRIYLAGNPVICGTNTWVYSNSTDVSYQAILANALSARALAVSVSWTWKLDSSGYCEITSIQW